MPGGSVVFDGVWKKFRRGERHDSLRDLIPSLVRRAFTSSHERELRQEEAGIPELEQRSAQAGGAAEQGLPRVAEATEINQRVAEQTSELKEKLSQLRDEIEKLEEFIGHEPGQVSGQEPTGSPPD